MSININPFELRQEPIQLLSKQKQDKLISGINIKTINEESILGFGNIEISGSGVVDSLLSETSKNPILNKAVTEAINLINDNITASEEVKDSISNLTKEIAEHSTVRFDRIEENEATINAGEIGSSPSAIVYYKPTNKFVAADSAGNYWDAWQGMEAYMNGNKIREDKVYLCGDNVYAMGSYYENGDILTYYLADASETQSPIFKDKFIRYDKVVKELWLNPQYKIEGNYRFKITNGRLYFRVYPQGSTTYYWNCEILLPTASTEIVELLVTQTNSDIPVGIPVGYILLDITKNIINSSGYGDIVDVEYVSNINNSPIINEYVQRTKLAASIGQEITSINTAIDYLSDKTIDREKTAVVDQFQNGDEVGVPLHTSSTFSGVGMYVGELNPFRYILSYAKCSDWVTSPKPVSKILLQIRQNNNEGVILYSQTLDVDIKPAEVKQIIFDLDEVKTFTGNLYIALRADSWCTFMQPKNSNYPFEPANGSTYPSFVYWTNGDISAANTGKAGTTSSGRNFYFQTFAEIIWNVTVSQDVLQNVKNALYDDIKEIVVGEVKGADISLPPAIDVVAGDTLQIFKRAVVKKFNPYTTDVLITCSKGKDYPRYYTFATTTADTGKSYPLKVQIKDDKGLVINEQSTTIKVIAPTTTNDKNILLVGASSLASGYISTELKRRLTENSGDGTPANPTGLGLNLINFVGRKTSQGVNQEATGGWKLASYAGEGVPACRFYVSGVTQLNMGDAYKIDGYEYTITEINVTDGVGNIRAEGQTKTALPASGTLTRSKGNGDESITYSRYEAESYNPFYNNETGKLDFISYANSWCNDRIDCLVFHCGVNDIFAGYSSAEMINSAKAIADAYHAQFPSGKVIFSSLPLPDCTGGMAANYGTGHDYYSKALKFWDFAQALEEFANEDEYKAYVSISRVLPTFDCEYGYPKKETPVNNRVAITEQLGTNGVHPTADGSKLVADAIYATLNKVL